MRLLPGLTCLIYPVLVWSISHLSALTLPLTLIPLIASITSIFRIGPSCRYARAVGIAHLGVAAPALYTDHSWLKSVHGISAAAITLFALFHITNHLTGLAGARAHLALMAAFRTVYRYPPLEGFLLTAVLVQIVSGFVLLRRRLMTTDRFEMLQGAAGAYLLMFFASHLRAVFTARYVHYTNTNWIWLTSSNLLTDEWSARLVPYYFLGIVALGLHGACGLRHVLLQHGRDSVANAAFWIFTVASVVAALSVLTGLVVGSFHSHIV